MSTLEKTYDPHSIEKSWYAAWEKAGNFKPQGQGAPYCIMLPPPNVTGSLHMGHGFQHTLMDALIRYHRMCGNNTLWQGGTDHAGIATQIVVERQLERDHKTRHDLGREKFLERVWEWKKESGDNITQQMRRLGSSIDWSRERFTMDENLSKAVQEAFIKLYQEKLIYRGKRLVNWDIKLQSAVSDLEVVNNEEAGQLYYLRYYLENSDDYLVVATTRPETLFGDVAVAVNPEDERYQKYIGKKVKLPLTDRLIPIIADDYVDPAFGTGCVKITPAHDFNDYAVGQRHQLPLINILHANGNLNLPNTHYDNVNVTSARVIVVNDLTEKNHIEKITDYKMTVPRCERTGEIIQPYLTDQWYVNMKPLAEPAIRAVETGELKFIPENWTKTYLQWLTNIQDWCISRQLWWGHRIPAWYDNNGNIYVGENEKSIREKNNVASDIILTQDEDVLDTWFSSALWPFATLGWPEQTPELNTFYPTNVLITGFDIIFFWVARMVMFGLHFTGKIPFKEVYITGLIRDQHGQKMSKSKGNVLDPIDLIDGINLDDLIKKRTFGLMNPKMEKQIIEQTKKEFPEGIPAFGTDALRFTFCALANTGRDISFDLGRVGGFRNFCNKLWNATRFVLMNVENFDIHAPREFNVADHWIQTKLQQTINAVHQYFNEYRFDLLAQTLYEFIWNDYCDWYIELAKINLTPGAQYTLLDVLENILRLMHPLMPYITEEIWQKISPLLNRQATTIQMQLFPEAKNTFDTTAVASIDWLQQVILAIRNIRGEMQVSPAKKITALLQHGSAKDKDYVTLFHKELLILAKLSSLEWSNEKAPPAATAVVGELQILLPIAGLIDKTAECVRLTKEIEKLQIEFDKCQQKLANPGYINKAPADVVAKERERGAEIERSLKKFSEQLQIIQKI